DQVERMKVLGQFKRNKFKVLVATDLASRGLHIGGLDLIVNYHLPKDPRDYKHRVGRLCREGQAGTSINFCTNRDKKLISLLEQEFKSPFTLN
ncbi:MAG: C-terminal helicase domain-containing protein, partial [Bdellovibrionota bacterium]|nr:C-terminal helicase domain-containing protein [Bdellovibrionota bacterium]